MRKRILGLVLALGLVAAPSAAFAQTESPEHAPYWRIVPPSTDAERTGVEVAGVMALGPQPRPIVLADSFQPYWRIVAPSTDPQAAPDAAVMGLTALRGIVEHGEGDVLLLNVGSSQVVVRLPVGRLPADAIDPGSLVEAVGVPAASGVLEGLHVTIWPA